MKATQLNATARYIARILRRRHRLPREDVGVSVVVVECELIGDKTRVK